MCFNVLLFQCILRKFGCEDIKMSVGFEYSNGQLTLYPSNEGIRLEVSVIMCWVYEYVYCSNVYEDTEFSLGLVRVDTLHVFVRKQFVRNLGSKGQSLWTVFRKS